MSKKKDRKGLGRGLSALMADIDSGPSKPSEIEVITSNTVLPIEKIIANKDQPRQDFNKDELDDLAKSIAARGIIQPIIVRAAPDQNGFFQIVAGERRWRAAQQAKLHEVPVVIREFNDEELLEVAIIENVQRANLNAIEEALGYKALMDQFDHTQEQVSSGLGKSRSYIANILRLLNLPVPVQNFIRDGILSAGHARTLIGNDRALELANIMIKEKMSVRQAEILAKQGVIRNKLQSVKASSKDSDTRAIEADLSANLALRVSIEHKDVVGSGKVIVSYKNLDDLDRICSILTGASK